MLYELVQFSDQIGPLNVFRYISFRAVGATVTALLVVFLFGPMMIDVLRVKQGKGQPIRDDGPQSHLSKKGTPTMGGLLILITTTAATLLWADLTNRYVWIVLGITLAFGAVGFWDDFLKVTKKNPRGVPAGSSWCCRSCSPPSRPGSSPSPRRRRCASPWRCRSSRTR